MEEEGGRGICARVLGESGNAKSTIDHPHTSRNQQGEGGGHEEGIKHNGRSAC